MITFFWLQTPLPPRSSPSSPCTVSAFVSPVPRRPARGGRGWQTGSGNTGTLFSSFVGGCVSTIVFLGWSVSSGGQGWRTPARSAWPFASGARTLCAGDFEFQLYYSTYLRYIIGKRFAKHCLSFQICHLQPSHSGMPLVRHGPPHHVLGHGIRGEWCKVPHKK